MSSSHNYVTKIVERILEEIDVRVQTYQPTEGEQADIYERLVIECIMRREQAYDNLDRMNEHEHMG